MLWIPITIAATGLQVARNALQRGLLGDAGPWGATLVRFLFGLPFALVALTAVVTLTPGARPNFGGDYWLATATGALSQLLASAALLAGYAWWAPLLLAGAWLATHWLLRESGVWRDRNTTEVREAQRHADYAYRLAVDDELLRAQ